MGAEPFGRSVEAVFEGEPDARRARSSTSVDRPARRARRGRGGRSTSARQGATASRSDERRSRLNAPAGRLSSGPVQREAPLAGDRRRSRAARGPRPAQARQLGPAGQVLGRRRERLRRQPGGVHDAGQRLAACTTSSPPCSPSASRSPTTSCWNRHWTFRATDGHMGFQAARFLTVSVLALGLNLIVLELLVSVGRHREGRRAGDRHPRRDAAQLHRQQAVELRQAGAAAASP